MGVGDGRIVEELLTQSKLHVVAVDADPKRVAALRLRLQDAGVYGVRVSVHQADPCRFALPPYMANLVVSADPSAFLDAGGRFAGAVFHVLRPYGGVACLSLSDADHARFARQVAQTTNPSVLQERGKLGRQGDRTTLTRVGALVGSDDWTHQYANASQGVVSNEQRVKTPLGVLWFGGPSHEGVLPRHGHGPSPQVAGGRLFIEGPDLLRCTDVYTGRLLWEKELADFGKYYNVTRHFAGAGEIGSNYVSLADHVYAVYGPAILELDSATGAETRRFTLKATAGQEAPNWGHICVWEDLLVATSSPVDVTSAEPAKSAAPEGARSVIPPHAKWRYLAGEDPPADWIKPQFDDSGWKTAAAGFGYGDNDDKTTLDMRGKFSRVYIRAAFDGKLAQNADELGLVINYDDAFIAYLNGHEIARAAWRVVPARRPRASARTKPAISHIFPSSSRGVCRRRAGMCSVSKAITRASRAAISALIRIW